MSKYSPVLISVFLILLLLSCTIYTPSAFNKKTFSPFEKPIDNFLLLYAEMPEDLYQLTEDSYDQLLRGRFNDFPNQNTRQKLHEAISNELTSAQVYPYELVFQTHKDYTFEEFKSGLDTVETPYVLLVTFKKEEFVGENLSRYFQIYLLDKHTGQPLWLSYGYRLSNFFYMPSLAKGIANELKNETIVMN
ncbi:hypothetical protein [Pararhodonellum marinum]|uniref:hypothetical protein n=1 Tax=Pararhodonellum marinum TaxID=2755358 RepID=UPI00188EFD7A|nr:hypothetical protein [Pararhodonellum marinum]